MRWSHTGRKIALAILVASLIGSCTNEASDRAGPTADPSPTPVAAPERLADGSPLPQVPVEIAAALDGPVIAAEAIPASHEAVETCMEHESGADGTSSGTFAGAFLTPFLGSAQFAFPEAVIAGEPPARGMSACDVLWRDDEIDWAGGALHPWGTDQALKVAGAAFSVAQAGDEQLGALSVPAPEGTAWLAHEHPGFTLVYPVTPGWPVRVSTPLDEPSDTHTIRVLYLDEAGERLGEEDITGVIAG